MSIRSEKLSRTFNHTRLGICDFALADDCSGFVATYVVKRYAAKVEVKL